MSWPVAIHLFAAVPALAVGLLTLTLKKGTALHKGLGRTWVALMIVTAGSSFWIQSLNPGHYSWIHLLAIWTLFSLVMAVRAIRWRRDRPGHVAWMVGTYVGLLIAGGLAFLPDRLLWRVFLG
jgi:uncharacterized membrane protein